MRHDFGRVYRRLVVVRVEFYASELSELLDSVRVFAAAVAEVVAFWRFVSFEQFDCAVHASGQREFSHGFQVGRIEARKRWVCALQQIAGRND